MSPVHSVPLLLGALIGALLALVVWTLLRLARRAGEAEPNWGSNDLVLWLLVLAAFALGAFLTYGLLGHA
jgi:hypothetical protein